MAKKPIRPAPISTEDYTYQGRPFRITIRRIDTQYLPSWTCLSCGRSRSSSHDAELMWAIARAKVGVAGHTCH